MIFQTVFDVRQQGFVEWSFPAILTIFAIFFGLIISTDVIRILRPRPVRYHAEEGPRHYISIGVCPVYFINVYWYL